jgi:hypothetical protein
MRRLCCVLALLLSGCRTLPFPDPHLEGDYGQTLKKWTRTVALYAGLETRAFVRVVYLSPQFVTAQAQMVSKMRAELPDQAAETLAKMREDFRQPTFFAIAYMPDRTANDWNEPASVWRIALNLGTGERAPNQIQRFERPFNAEMRALYPYLDEYSTAYLLRFPEPTAEPVQTKATNAHVPPPRPMESFIPAELHLVIAGALGRMTFNWRLDSAPEPPSEGKVEEEPPAK